MEGFTDEEIQEALLLTDNFVPLAIKVSTRKRSSARYYQPPAFYEKGKLTEPRSFSISYEDKKSD